MGGGGKEVVLWVALCPFPTQISLGSWANVEGDSKSWTRHLCQISRLWSSPVPLRFTAVKQIKNCFNTDYRKNTILLLPMFSNIWKDFSSPQGTKYFSANSRLSATENKVFDPYQWPLLLYCNQCTWQYGILISNWLISKCFWAKSIAVLWKGVEHLRSDQHT